MEDINLPVAAVSSSTPTLAATAATNADVSSVWSTLI